MTTKPDETSADSAGRGATRMLAAHAATLAYDAIPAQVISLTKQYLLDTLGVAIGASSLAPEAKIIDEYVRDFGGRAESTVLGFGGKAPAAWAAFVNGSLGHMLDYDDVGDHCHYGIATVPVAFAIAEKRGGASGRDLLAAIVAGTDVHARLAQSIDIPDWTMSEGWFATQLLGGLSGAAVAARLMGLDGEAIENAFGIAYTQMGGSRQMAVNVATHLRSMQAGFSGQAAILSAELTARGIVGSKEVIEGRYGLFRNYVRTSTPRWSVILDGLGSRFPVVDTHCFKVWPACAVTRPTNAAMLELRRKHSLRPEDIASITVVSNEGDKTHLLSVPVELKRRPRTSIDAKYSVPFTLAAMMVHGDVRLRHYTPEALDDPAVLDMADRIDFRAASAADGGAKVKMTPIVEVKTRDGRALAHQVPGVPGDPNNPVSQALLEEKFRDCVSFAVNPVSKRNVEKVIELVADLENVPDATDVMRLLA
ncbi:MAG TPA: MmgE/PrpD family protein [Burkholderiales bacterium]|nr:MmgE/PrpD family protein [Burkholderiales bacterium]